MKLRLKERDGKPAGSLGVFTASSNSRLSFLAFPHQNFTLTLDHHHHFLTIQSILVFYPLLKPLLKMSVIPALALPPSPTSSVLPSFSRSPHSHSVPPPNPSYEIQSPPSPPPMSTEEPLVHLQNCRIASDQGVGQPSSIWFDPCSGKIVGAQEAFYAAQERGREVREVDMGGDVVAPGYVQIFKLIVASVLAVDSRSTSSLSWISRSLTSLLLVFVDTSTFKSTVPTGTTSQLYLISRTSSQPQRLKTPSTCVGSSTSRLDSSRQE